ncbi:helix-turn-helix domain-containing protein [Arthrobacter sp. 92]|jgi:transcriptional regulator with XRE-family HTH domain|uniref:helix-turn-helix domain-containing protein n=1 Tax=Arthrobacter sp. 92 TaxID=3418175 RepID=UPI003CFE6417
MVGEDQLQVAFGLAVRRVRVAAGMTQQDLAQVSGVDRTYISGLERGHCNPTLTIQGKLAASLGLPLSSLISEAEAINLAL